MLLWLCTLLAILTAAFVAYGGPLLTHVLQTYLGHYFGKCIQIEWSCSKGSLFIRHIHIQPAITEILNPYIPLPLTISTLILDQIDVQFPLWPTLRSRDINLLRIKFEIENIQLRLAWDEPEKWIWSRESNSARKIDSIKDAATARLASLNTMTLAVFNKLTQLQILRKKARGEMALSTPAQNASAPAWQRALDVVIDAFELKTTHFSLSIETADTKRSIQIRLQAFELYPALKVAEMKPSILNGSMDTMVLPLRQRLLQISCFHMNLGGMNAPKSESSNFIRSLTLKMKIYMPQIVENVVFRPQKEENIKELDLHESLLPDFGEKDRFNAEKMEDAISVCAISITFETEIVLELRPSQVAYLLEIFRPIKFYYDWQQRARIADELACVELSSEERMEYRNLFAARWKLEQTGLLLRLYSSYKNKEQVNARNTRLQELEAHILSSELLCERTKALGWEIPSGGKPLRFVEKDLKEKKDILKFANSSTNLRDYEPQIPIVRPILDQVLISLKLTHARLELRNDDKNAAMLSLFAEDVNVSFSMLLKEMVKPIAQTMTSDVLVRRFGVLDCRNARSNVFCRLVDRNIECESMLTVSYEQLGSSEMAVHVNLKDFSVLIVFGPLLHIVHAFMPALEEEEQVQLKYLETESISVPLAPEEKLMRTPTYVKDVPQEYMPHLLGGMLLRAEISVHGVEICLVGDSSTLKSHVLAFTSDIQLKIASSDRYEATNLELSDVALQPCTLKLSEEGILLQLKSGGTILELEGEGVDLELGYRLTKEKAELTSLATPSNAISKLPQNMWTVARTAARRREIVQVTHPEADKLEQEIRRTHDNSRRKAEARRRIVLNMSDFALNLSPSDLSVFISILSSLHSSLKEDEAVVKEREARIKRLEKARKELEEQRFIQRLKAEFTARDTDGGGSLDTAEIAALLETVDNCRQLTKDELDATVADFIAIVDGDHSGDITIEEFESALNRKKIAYDRLHHGNVVLTGEEYVHPQFQRQHVPLSLSSAQDGDDKRAHSVANISALRAFYDTYTTQTNCSQNSLNGQPPALVQKKMVRVFRNYEYAQEAWLRLIKPQLQKLSERADWLLRKEMPMGGRSNVIDELLSNFSAKDRDENQAFLVNLESFVPAEALSMFVNTTVSTSFGGFYFRLKDELLPLGTPALEFSMEELAWYANCSMHEGKCDSEAVEGPTRAHMDNFGIARLSFDIYAKYYNTSARQMEPVIEYYHGTLDVRKETNEATEILYTSDRYFQFNLTAAFVQTVNATIASFYSVNESKERKRTHVKEENGAFYMLNESGVPLKYYVVSKKQSQERFQEIDIAKEAQKSEKDALSEIISEIALVPVNGAHVCRLLKAEDELKAYEQQSMKEKYLRQAFRAADVDGSGELEANEVREVLAKVFGEDEQGNGSVFARGRTVSRENFDEDIQRAVEDFMAFADTDKSGKVSWDEFKAAIAKTRATNDRYLSVEIEGCEAIHEIPLAAMGQTQVYELTKRFLDLEKQMSIEKLYREAVMRLNSGVECSKEALERAFACLKRVKALQPGYEWVDSYYAECSRMYLPTLLAVCVEVDHSAGLQVRVFSAESIENGTDKETQCVFYDANGCVADCNTFQPRRSSLWEQDAATEERYCILPPRGKLPIPLDLVQGGTFAIRQIGESEWSNTLPCSIKDQRLYKQLTSFEQKEVLKAQRGESKPSLPLAKRMVEAMGDAIPAPTDISFHALGANEERTYPSRAMIDDQPTIVIEKAAFNDPNLSSWAIRIQPQLVIENVLPCAIEYAIVQPRDCPENSLDSHKRFQSARKGQKLDYFSHVSQINARRMYVESGKSIEIFGLDLDQDALIKIRLCADSNEPAEKSTWGPPLLLHLQEMLHQDTSHREIEMRVRDGPVTVVRLQNKERERPRQIVLYAPYWILNRSGLDLEYHLHKGYIATTESHRQYFNGGRHALQIPQMATAPLSRALLCVRPYQSTSSDLESPLPSAYKLQKVSKLCPNFAKVGWSDPCDMSNVGTGGELRPSHISGSNSFVLAYQVHAAPRQFFRSKILVLSPRYVFISRVPRLMQVMAVALDKRHKRSKDLIFTEDQREQYMITLQENEAVQVYRFCGPEKVHGALLVRDAALNSTYTSLGPFSPCIPWTADGQDISFWTRGPLEDAPACNVSFRNNEETIFAQLKDVSSSPRYRLENRSTQHSFRYFQRTAKSTDEMILPPLTSHSFLWSDPLAKDLILRVLPMHYKIPTDINFMKIGVVKGTTMKDMYAEVYISGSTRVLAIGDTEIYYFMRQKAIFEDVLKDLLIDCALHGVALSIVDSSPQEVLNLTMENLRISSKAGTRGVVFSLHHFQIDDMTSTAQYPVVLAPLDSGYNSDKREGWLPTDKERPFFVLSVRTAPQSGIPIIEDFDLTLHSMTANVNLEYVLTVGNLLASFIPANDEAQRIQYGMEEKNAKLRIELLFPEPDTMSQGMLMYFKRWRMSGFDMHLVFDSVQEERGEGISYFLGSTLGSIIGGIAHVTPDISFSEIKYENRFFYEYDLLYAVIWDIVYSVLGQWYKIVGSAEFLGDPVGLATDIVDGFAHCARQLKRDVSGKSLRKGESALILAQTIVGAPSKSVSKVSNGLGDLLKKATRFQSQEDPDEPRHVPEGLLQSGIVFTKSLAHGMSGFVEQPYRGARDGGMKGFAKGVGFGTLQLMACPIVGTLGAVEKFSQSVNNTTHLLDDKSEHGTRRPARKLEDNPLKALSDSIVITEAEVHVLAIENLPEHSNPKVVIRVLEKDHSLESKEKLGNYRQVGEYKTSTLHHTGSPKFDQSWLISIRTMDTLFEVVVYHKRKPLPKKKLGILYLSMEEIYRDFDAVPAKILQDTKTRLKIKKRKRYPGSILRDLALSSGACVELRDDNWRQRLRKTTAASVFDDEENGEPDEYSQDLFNLQNATEGKALGMSLDPQPVAFELQESESKAKIMLSVRYVNDMRR